MADPDFWEGDLFMQTEEIVSLLDAQDWNTIRLSWQARDEEYKQRFWLSIGEAPSSVLAEWAFDLLGTLELGKIEDGLSLLAHSGTQRGVYIGGKEIEVIANVWQANPLMRADIQHILWSMGKSGQLRRFLGFERWSDALLPEQPAL